MPASNAAPCLDCGEPIAIEMRDARMLSIEPATIVGYAYSPIGGSLEERPLR